MLVEDEVSSYEKALVNLNTGEIEAYETHIFNNVIRAREIKILKKTFQIKEANIVLDYCCGGGWVSKILSNFGHLVIGLDLNPSLIQSARVTAFQSAFVIGDGMNLPFREDIFDDVVSIAALHHLDVVAGVREIKSILKDSGKLLLMEPNKLNPLSAFGRTFFPMDTHTRGESPLILSHLINQLNQQGFEISLISCLFFFSFPLARLLKIMNLRVSYFIVRCVFALELLFENLPYLNLLNSTFVMLAE